MRRRLDGGAQTAEAPASPAPERGASLWRNADFLRLWSAQTISQFGTQITMLALPLAAILVLDASAFEVAALAAVEWTPWLVFSLPAGAWVDRLPRRAVLVVADLGRAVALLSIPAAYFSDVLTLWQLYGVGFLVGTLTVFFDVAYVAYLPSLVERRRLGEGNAKLEMTRSGAQVGGPGIAGLAVQVIGAPVAILADAVSYLVSAFFLGAIRGKEETRPRTDGTRLRTEVVEGIRFVLGHPYMRPSMAFVAAANFFWNMAGAILLVYAVRDLGLSPATIGLVFTIFFVATFAGVASNVLGISLFQATTPDRLQGRATASRRLVNFGVVPLGSLAGGGLAATIGLRETLWVGAVGATLAFLPLLFSPIRHVREVPEEEPEISLPGPAPIS